MTAFYNENDPYAAQWLRNLIERGLIAPGVVDERDIRDIEPWELVGFRQCHFFAGIGVWSHALRRAGWPDDLAVWTGSCPCQPFSEAGAGGGFADERHLWPAWHHLIEQCKPSVVFGEQVASKAGLVWLDLVHADLEGTGYSVGAVDLGAASVGAPHIRQRLWFVADAAKGGQREHGRASGQSGHIALGDTACGVAQGDAGLPRLEGRDARAVGRQLAPAERTGAVGDGWMDCALGLGRNARRHDDGSHVGQLVDAANAAGGVGDTAGARLLPGAHAGIHRSEEGTGTRHGESERSGRPGGVADDRGGRRQVAHLDDGSGAAAGGVGQASELGMRSASFWSDAEWIACTDGKARPVEPGTFPLAHGAAARVGRLRAYGNAIVAPLAEEFIRAYLDVWMDAAL